jgi:hypothetical protein
LVCVLLAAALAAMPALSGGGDGGGQSGGSTVNSANIGITILPAPLCSLSGPLPEQPRIDPTYSGQQDIVLVLGTGMGPATAAIVEDLTARAISLPVVGPQVTIERGVLTQLAANGVRGANLIIVDAEGRGYRIRVLLLETGAVQLLIY